MQRVRHDGNNATVWNAPDSHRFGNVLQRMRTQILKLRTYLSTNLPVRVVGNANTTRLGDTFETHCNIDTVTKDIIVFDDDVTDVNANAKFDPLVLGHIGILLRHAALDFVGAS